MDVLGARPTLELAYQKNPKKNIVRNKISCMYTNSDTVTNKMHELKACVENDNPWIIVITEVTSKNYRIPVQKAELEISKNYDIFPENISCKGRGITIQVHKELKPQEISFKTDFEESICCEVN